MNRLDFTHVVFLIGMIGFCLITANPCIAQGETGTLSGTVVDKNGEPIPDFTINLSPAFQISKTDEKGAFTFTNVPAGQVQIAIPVQQPKQNENEASDKFLTESFKPDYEIVTIKIGDITIFQDGHPAFGGVKFGIKSGSKIENVVVTVQPRMRIRARVVFKDGKPLANTRISREIVHIDVDNKGSGSSSGGSVTNSEGYFVHYIQKNEVPANFTVTVKYKGFSAESKKILIEEGTRYDDLVLTLDIKGPANKTPIKPPFETAVEPFIKPKPRTSPRESLPNLLRKLTKTPKQAAKPNANQPILSQPSNTMRHPMDRSSWVVNPANGHAYKKIRCRSLDDAHKRAKAEGAYLVAINDEAEQKWLSGVFGNRLYWIGLSDTETEGQWVWQNGEPLTYKNWGLKQRFPRSPLSEEEKDGVVMTFIDSTWHAVGPGDLFWRLTRQAIIEKGE
ncbi:hypothetical protein C6501_17870 [Candidatus Poribacteria bacterium]|nr:MAG: hypothetical protein C6501_17870 [Candidatus Poribacteria bacterium]